MLELFKTMELDKSSDIPLYIQLYDKLKELIDSAVLLPGLRLPSIRRLAQTLEVNPVTVVSAFRRLETEGYVYSKEGSGTFVNLPRPAAPAQEAASAGSTILDELYDQDDLSATPSSHININEHTINFASATPTPDLFPVDDFKLVLNEVLDRDKGNAFGYHDIQGYEALRECICELSSRGGINCSLDTIQIISGAQQGIDIISKAFLSSGDHVIIESPTYSGAIAVFRSRGAETLEIEMGEDGTDLTLLEYYAKNYHPKLLYAIPSFQNPTGRSYSEYKRRELLRLSQKYNFYIIEDDYVSDLDFEGLGLPSLKSMDTHDRVIFIKSFSKIFMPGLRLGFMIAPSSIRESLLKAKHTTDISTSSLIQRAFDLYLRRGCWEKHFKFMYEIYKDRYYKTIEALDRYLHPEMSFSRPGGGLNIWLELPDGFPVNTLLKQASASNLVFAPGRIFYGSPMTQKLNTLRLSFASVYTPQIRPGIEQLCSLIAGNLGSGSSSTKLPIL